MDSESQYLKLRDMFPFLLRMIFPSERMREVGRSSPATSSTSLTSAVAATTADVHGVLLFYPGLDIPLSCNDATRVDVHR